MGKIRRAGTHTGKNERKICRLGVAAGGLGKGEVVSSILTGSTIAMSAIIDSTSAPPSLPEFLRHVRQDGQVPGGDIPWVSRRGTWLPRHGGMLWYRLRS